MSIGPPTGMRDWLPHETLLRQRLMETIGSVYRLYGYLPIDTPALEDLEVLLGKGGGENEKLLFKVLKRGEKLAQAKENELADYGLRYDLTVPLARFVASHQGKLPKIFRRYHIAPVWRADRPQKARYREFYQCDIDVVGGASSAYEVEIITATERVLRELKLGTYWFRITDQRLLPLVLGGFGVHQDKITPITVILDKLDKMAGGSGEAFSELQTILPEGSEELKKTGGLLVEAYADRNHETGRYERLAKFSKYLDLIENSAIRAEIDRILQNVKHIIDAVMAINPSSRIVFDPILVRGMDYYTGPIYEAVVEGFPSSILGGGRYDGLIGRFAGKDIPAVGCSIGFERILAILHGREDALSSTVVARTLLLRQAQEVDDTPLNAMAEQLRNGGIPVETYLDADPVKKQLDYAEQNGIRWVIKSVHNDGTLTIRELATRQDRIVSLDDFKSLLGI